MAGHYLPPQQCLYVYRLSGLVSSEEDTAINNQKLEYSKAILVDIDTKLAEVLVNLAAITSSGPEDSPELALNASQGVCGCGQKMAATCAADMQILTYYLNDSCSLLPVDPIQKKMQTVITKYPNVVRSMFVLDRGSTARYLQYPCADIDIATYCKGTFQ